MAIVAKFTRTLPAPSATISGGFVFLLSTGWFTDSDQGAAGSPIDGGTNSLANGGGDMQIFSDAAATTRLPIEVVTFVTGGSPQCQVWVRTPSYTAGDTITIGKDGVQSAQPSVGAAFGRNDTWQDYEAVIHADETGTNGVFVDSTGNAHDTTLTTGAALPTTSANHPFLGTWPSFDKTQVLTLFNSFASIDNTAFSLSYWGNFVTDGVPANGSAVGVMSSRRNTGDNNWASIQLSKRIATKGNSTENLATLNLAKPNLTTFYNKCKQDSSRLDYAEDGIILASDTSVTSGESIVGNSGNDFRLMTYYDDSSARRVAGEICEIRIKRAFDSNDFDASEYLNQNDTDNFGTSSEYILVGGGPTENNVSSAFNLSALSFSTLLDNTPVENNTSSAFNLTSLSFSALLDNTPIENNVSSAFNLTSLSFSAFIDNAASGNSSSSAFSLSTLSFSAVLDNTPVENSSSSAFNLSALSFSAIIDNLPDGNSVNTAFNLSALSFSAVIDNTPVENSTSSAFNLGALQFATRIQNGDLITIVIESNSIVQSTHSRTIIQPTFSTNVKGK